MSIRSELAPASVPVPKPLARACAREGRDAVVERLVRLVAREASDGPAGAAVVEISGDLARGMSGDLTTDSEEGVGSAFRFVLPRAR